MTRDPSPVVLTIAGSDSGGGAGIQADLKSIEAGGTSAVTGVTAQNTRGVERSHVLDVADVQAQIEAVLEETRAAAEALVEMGADAALVKGGHVSGEMVVDVLVVGEGPGAVHHMVEHQ